MITSSGSVDTAVMLQFISALEQLISVKCAIGDGKKFKPHHVISCQSVIATLFTHQTVKSSSSVALFAVWKKQACCEAVPEMYTSPSSSSSHTRANDTHLMLSFRCGKQTAEYYHHVPSIKRDNCNDEGNQ